MKKDITESKRVAEIIGAVGKQCYYNAFRVVFDIPEYSKADYVEGYAVYDSGLIEHGWVEKDGVIVDPTLPQDDMTYFPGLRFRGGTGVSEAMLEIPKPKYTTVDLPIFYRFGLGIQEHPGMKAAWDAALATQKQRIDEANAARRESLPGESAG